MESRNRYDGVDAYAVTKIRYQARQLARSRAFHPSDIEDLELELMLGNMARRPAGPTPWACPAPVISGPRGRCYLKTTRTV